MIKQFAKSHPAKEWWNWNSSQAAWSSAPILRYLSSLSIGFVPPMESPPLTPSQF